MRILGFWEMPEEDQPPELIYHHEGKLKAHFDEVKEKHKRRYKRTGADEELEDVPQTDNEHAAAARKELGLK